MPRINILSPFVADLIAAGEVVERPASAVKELMENAVDARARNVTVELRGGGAEYIRVTDDGCGMSPEDAGIAFLRHATSKLADERGLEAIGTLGFRGEALAAIGSVSHVELLTRERGAETGTRLLLDGGEISDMREAGCPEGTSITVRGLFYNTPARLKFMKSDRAEGTACVQAALRCALARPELSVRCIRDGSEEFFTPGDGRAESAVYSLLGRELASQLLPVHSVEGPIEVSGFTGSPAAGRGSRSAQFFFCNGRFIKSQLLQAAVEQAYRGTLLTGRYPSCVIYLKLSAAAVDVNVHPAKTEVKFSDERRVFDAVHYAVLGALEQPRAPRAEEAGELEVSPAKTEISGEPVRHDLGYNPYIVKQEQQGGPARRDIQLVAEYSARGVPARQNLSAPPAQTELNLSSAQPPEPDTARRMPGPEAAPARGPVEPAAGALTGSGPEPRLIGEALELYILVQYGDELVIIDKHAAHERMIYDRLRQGGAEYMSQGLLEPQTFTLPGPASDALRAELDFVNSLGFEVEPYGERSFVLRAVPGGMAPDEAVGAVEEAAEALASSRRPDRSAARDEVLKTVACKAAIKAGRSSEPEELKLLARAVCRGEVRYCPHGRPVSWALGRKELDKQFKRIL